MSDAIDALFAAVWANPEDDATRLVLADALLAIGDPRGELIHLQFSDRHDEGAARRLLQRHGMTWLGALRGNVIPLAYEKGFLASCMVTDAEGAAGCGEWGTVHTVQLQDVAHLPLLEGMAILRAVIHAEPEIVAKLVKLPVAWRLEALGATESQPLAVAHTALECLPRLRIAEAPAFRLSRAADGRLSHLAARWSRDLGLLFEMMPPPSIATATIIDVPQSQRDDLQARLTHFTDLAANIVPMTPQDDRWWEQTHVRDEHLERLERERAARERSDGDG